MSSLELGRTQQHVGHLSQKALLYQAASRITTDGRVRCGTTIAIVRGVPRDSEAARWLGRYPS